MVANSKKKRILVFRYQIIFEIKYTLHKMKISAYIFRLCKKKLRFLLFAPLFELKDLRPMVFFRFFSKIWLWPQIKKNFFPRCPHARGPVGSPKQALFKNVFRFVLSQSARKLSPFPFFWEKFSSLNFERQKIFGQKNPFYSM